MNIFTRQEQRKQDPRRKETSRDDLRMLQMSLGQWFQTPQGIEVLKAEKAIAKPAISRLFGYHILQVGCHPDYSLIEDSPVGHKILFAPTWQAGKLQAVADNEELPLAADSIDVVLVHHALDFTEDSHRLLREVTRVLRPGGHMLIVGFNPFSPWGFWKLFRSRARIPWRGRFISRGRLADWLQLMDLRIDRVQYGLHFSPMKFNRLLGHATRLEELGKRFNSPFGGAYFVLCVKQVATMTPIVPRWEPLRARPGVLPAAENVRLRKH